MGRRRFCSSKAHFQWMILGSKTGKFVTEICQEWNSFPSSSTFLMIHWFSHQNSPFYKQKNCKKQNKLPSMAKKKRKGKRERMAKMLQETSGQDSTNFTTSTVVICSGHFKTSFSSSIYSTVKEKRTKALKFWRYREIH